eukprot:TRINITY_DN3586_c0_g1_i10.p1 TRINITY_DN3586_c0_g1~~TRINITY_DN3586_c0_g1_i10.p1  ORF type:complete len:290 (+),score=61.90 TRINITY_DN3586_c0_g1_i10:40-909(+)
MGLAMVDLIKQSSLDLDLITRSEYSQDIVAWLKRRELELPEYKRMSPQLSQRRKLIDWSTMVAEKLELSNCTVHLAVKILDLFMDGHDIQDPQLYLVCLVSILLASKIEEKDDRIPKCSKLNSFVKSEFPLSDFKALEYLMLKYFKWKLGLPTACHFAEIWLAHAISPTDSHNNGPLVSFREARAYFHQYVKYFLDLSMQDDVFIDVPPSKLAAALLAASRVSFGLTPTWSSNLAYLTGFRFAELQDQIELLLRTFKMDDMEEKEDEGYISLMGSPEQGMTSSPELMET